MKDAVDRMVAEKMNDWLCALVLANENMSCTDCPASNFCSGVEQHAFIPAAIAAAEKEGENDWK